MASAQLMEEELQHSVRVSEGDADHARVEAAGSATKEQKLASTADTSASSAAPGTENSDFLMNSDIDTADDGRLDHVDEDEDPDHHDDDGAVDSEGDDPDMDAEGEEDDEAYDDAEGDEFEDALTQPLPTEAAPDVEENGDPEDDEGDDEGVGAVKFRPGETDDEDSEDDDASEASASDEESEGAAEWEDAVENDEEEEGNESGDESPNTCIFCKQDEENDPGEEFEAFLVCSRCGENSHQQCARDNEALDDEIALENWKCPECVGHEPDDASGAGDVELHGARDGDDLPATTRRSTAPKLARDLLPPQKGNTDPESHSVFNHLVLDDDPMDGSRVLRKRKTSSAEEVDDSIMSLRKRRKSPSEDEGDDGFCGAVDELTRPRSARSSRLRVGNSPQNCTIIKHTRTDLVVQMRVKPTLLRHILSQKPKGEKKRLRRGSTMRSSRLDTSRNNAASIPTMTAPFASANFSQPFYSFFDKETDELKGKPYGGILTEAEADTSKTLPTNDDRRRFDQANQKAEHEWRKRVLDMQAEITELSVKRPKKSAAPASQIECIEFGGWEIDTWYAAPYPEEYSRNRVLYICEFCLKYMNSDYVAWRHKLKCPAKHPPGDEIYRSGSVSVFEVDGRKNPVYCQNLCLLAKLFLGSKTLYYDVEPFLFYVLCEYDNLGYHFVGYFSKEKRASSQNNVSCILTLPIHQRKGYGNLLIDFSYLLTRVEKKTGSPEKPLSDMGLVSYRNYWRLIMCRYLLKHVPEDKESKMGTSIKQISDDTGLTPDDVVSALEGLRCIVRDPQTGLYAFRADLAYCREYVAKWESKNYVTLDAQALTWTPYVMGRSIATNFELGPALTAIAPREEDEDQKTVEVAPEVIPNGENSTVEAPTNDVVHKTEAELDSTVLESTEPNETDTQPDPTEDEGKPVRDDALPLNSAHNSAQSSTTPGEGKQDEWAQAYKHIPATRFQVFPALSGTRRFDRPKPAVARNGNAARPKYKRPVGSVRQTTTARPKSNSTRTRVPGGTGRGPGRWPKGTKKSDYGNAASGPGLPPGWLAQRQRAAITSTKTNGDGQTEDTVQVQTVQFKQSGESAVSTSNGIDVRGKASPKSSRGGARAANSGASSDVVMKDANLEDEDVDA